MPGLTGIIGTTPANSNRSDLLEMTRSMQHESFYSSGTYINEEVGLYIGWTCHKGSFCDYMPIMNKSQEFLLFFYGEHFMDQNSFDELYTRGHAIEKFDARVLLHLYEEKGFDFLKCLNGWFHGLIVNLKNKEMALFNDRYGMQRLYYYEERDNILFASEAKAILKVRKELRTLDPRSVGEYLTCDCVLQDRTFFHKVFKLEGGSLWTFKNARQQKRERYFEPQEWENQSRLGEDKFSMELENLFPRIMERYVQSSLPLGISLSGGLDTRQLMAYINSQRFRIPCYSFDGMYRESFDAKIAKKVATACGQNHQSLVLDRDFLFSFPKLAEETVYLSDGCLDVCSAYELYLNRLARQIATVRLTGSYGSEVFRGLRGMKSVSPDENMIHQDYREHINNAMNVFKDISKCHNLTFSVFRQAPWYGYGRLSVEQSQVVLRTPFMDNDLVGLMYRTPDNIRASTQLQWRLIEHANPALIAIPTDRGLLGRSGTISSRWAYFVSYFLFKADYLYKSGMPHWMEQMHYLLGPLQPEKLLIGRHRFYHFRIWFRNELSTYLKDVLLDPIVAQRPYLNGEFIEPMVMRHIKGDRNYTEEIGKVLTLEMIQRLFVDS